MDVRTGRANHIWKFEYGHIDRTHLNVITKDFKKIAPFIETIFLTGVRESCRGIEEADYWTCFHGVRESTSDIFLFGTENITSGQSVYINTGLYNDGVMAFLSIAKKHLGHDIHVRTSVSALQWGKALSLCSNILGHAYDLMDITDNGKLRFKTWELDSYHA